jgi:hypothetical protein
VHNSSADSDPSFDAGTQADRRRGRGWRTVDGLVEEGEAEIESRPAAAVLLAKDNIPIDDTMLAVTKLDEEYGIAVNVPFSLAQGGNATSVTPRVSQLLGYDCFAELESSSCMHVL